MGVKLSYSDVLVLGIAQGLTYHRADEIAQELCPEYRMTTEAKAIRAIRKAAKA